VKDLEEKLAASSDAQKKAESEKLQELKDVKE